MSYDQFRFRAFLMTRSYEKKMNSLLLQDQQDELVYDYRFIFTESLELQSSSVNYRNELKRIL